VTNYAPEYEDCRRIAAEHHVPLKTVIQEAARAYLGACQQSQTQRAQGRTG
jgi:pyridinium-3,5-bisthiocarboxylic acid mononucleotide nickel chelatase